MTAAAGKIREVFIRLVLAGMSVLIGLLLMEGGLRLYGIQPGAKDRLSLFEFDEVLGWRTKPSYKVFRSTPFYAHFRYFDRYGFPTSAERWTRDLDHQAPTAALVGDSFAEGYYLPYAQTCAYLLEERLGKQVVNLGVSGYSPDQYLLTSREHLPDFNVEEIIVLFFPYNDIPGVHRGVYQGYAKPLFGDDLSAPINTPLTVLRGREQKSRWVHLVTHRSALFTALRPFFGRLYPLAEESDQVPLYEAGRMRTAMRMIRQIQVEFPDAGFAVYYLPHYREVEGGTLAANAALFLSICEELGLRCGSPVEALAEMEDPVRFFQHRRRQERIEYEGHLSDSGSVVVVNEILRLLHDPEPARPVSRVGGS